MKLLIATDNFLPRWDGIARFLSEIIPRLEMDVTVVSPDYGLTAMDLKIQRVLVPTRRNAFGDYTPAQYRPGLIEPAVKKADVVFSQTIGPVGMLAHRYARKHKKPLVAFIHSIEWELVPKALDTSLLKRLAYPLMKLYTRYLYNKCSLLIVPSENIADMLTWQRISTPKKVVHLGVDHKKFTRGNKKEARKALGIPEDAFVVGFHGRLGYEKNLLTLSRAFMNLKAKNKRLLVVGEGVEKLRLRLQKVKGILLPGKQTNVVLYLQAMDVYVMPSFTETTSLAVLEAMACELPIVASPVGFIQQYIADGTNGYFFETKNWYNLSRKLQVLHDDVLLREKLGKAARKTILSQFNWEETAKGIREALLTVSRTQGRRRSK